MRESNTNVQLKPKELIEIYAKRIFCYSRDYILLNDFDVGAQSRYKMSYRVKRSLDYRSFLLTGNTN